MTKIEAATILARSAIRASVPKNASSLSSHLSELAYTMSPDSLIFKAIDAQPAMRTILSKM